MMFVNGDNTLLPPIHKENQILYVLNVYLSEYEPAANY